MLNDEKMNYIIEKMTSCSLKFHMKYFKDIYVNSSFSFSLLCSEMRSPLKKVPTKMNKNEQIIRFIFSIKYQLILIILL